MGRFLRVAAGLSCLGILALGAIALDPAGPILSSFKGCSAKRISLTEELVRSEHIARTKEASVRRAEAKEQIAREVIARRCSLAEAMEQFRALDQEWPQFNSGAQKAADLRISEDEWDGRGVILYVRRVLEDRPNEAATVGGRLDKELQELLADGKKRPPKPVAPRTEERIP